MFRVGIAGTGGYLPRRVVPNEELFDSMNDDQKARLEKLGARERRWASPDEKLPVMMSVASSLALEDAGLTPNDIDGIYIGTNSTDPFLVPHIATRVQYLLGASQVNAADLGAGCTGGLQAIRTGLTELFYRRHAEKITKPLNILVGAGDVMSNVTRGSTPISRAILGDGAGAMVLSILPESQEHLGIYSLVLRGRGDLAHLISYTSGYGGQPPSDFLMSGSKVHEFVLDVTPEMITEAFSRAGISLSEIERAKVAPHQMNSDSLNRLPIKLKKKLEFVPLKSNIYTRGSVDHGNTSGAGAFLALDDMNRSGGLVYGDLVMMPVWGAGMTEGIMLAGWSKQTPSIRSFEDRTEQERLLAIFNPKYAGFEHEVDRIRRRDFGEPPNP